MKKVSALIALIALVSVPFLASAATLTTSLVFGNASPAPGSSTSITGDCGAAGGSNTVSFSLIQSGATTTLPSTANLTTNSNGTFSGVLNFPTTATSGPATIQVLCNATGDVINSSTITFTAPTAGSFATNSTSPTIGGSYTLAGNCGNSNGTGTVQLSLLNNGNTTSFGSVALDSSGGFSNTITIPSAATAGSGTVTATCSNGTTFSSPVTISQAGVNSFSTNSSPNLGSNATVSGTCTGTGNSNGNTTFSLIRNGVTTPLASTSTTTDTNGTFNSSVYYPTSYGSGPATLQVTCPNGTVYTSQVSIIDPTATSGTSTTTPSTTATTTPGGGLTFPTTGSVSGTSTTPTGGVNAGLPPRSTLPIALGIAMIILGTIGAAIAHRSYNHAKI